MRSNPVYNTNVEIFLTFESTNQNYCLLGCSYKIRRQEMSLSNNPLLFYGERKILDMYVANVQNMSQIRKT